MVTHDYIKKQIDDLPESVLERIMEFISFQRYTLGLFDNETDYLVSMPGMTETIKKGMNTPLSECIPLSEAWGDV